MIKKVIAILTIFALTIGLNGCGMDEDTPQPMNTPTTTSTTHETVDITSTTSAQTSASTTEPTDVITETRFETVLVSNETELRAAIAQAQRTPTAAVLTTDIELISNFVLPTNANMKLTGENEVAFKLISTRDMDVITIEEGAELTVEHIIITRSVGTAGRGIVNNDGVVFMNNSIISGHTRGDSNFGGGVFNSGTFTMAGGAITDNTHDVRGRSIQGIAVYNSGTFTMNDGTISNNSSDGYRSGTVHNIGTFIINDGTIHNNILNERGAGAIFNKRGDFIMNGGSIYENTSTGSSYGSGGVFNDGGTFTLNDGVIRDNVGQFCGGVLNDNSLLHGGRSTFTMKNGAISGNGENSVNVNNQGDFIMYNGIIDGENIGRTVDLGGNFTMHNGTIRNSTDRGIYISCGASFTINSGTIYNNSNGGVCVTASSRGNGSFVMNGGIIRNNSANGNGGGVLISRSTPAGTVGKPTFVMNGGRIHDNVSTESGGGIFIGAHSSFTFDGGWIFDNNANSDKDFHISQNAGDFNNNVLDPNVGAIGSSPPQ
jgi:hypothetical protein